MLRKSAISVSVTVFVISDHLLCEFSKEGNFSASVRQSLLACHGMCLTFPLFVEATNLTIEQLRRQARERRVYIYAKSLEAQERQTFERKRQLREALASGKQLPTELKKDAKNLGKDLAFDDAQAGLYTSDICHPKIGRAHV